MSCLIYLASKGRFLTVCGEGVNRLSQINQLVNEIGLLAHVISKFVADFSKSILCPMSFCTYISCDGFFELKELLIVLLVPSCRFAFLRPPS